MRNPANYHRNLRPDPVGIRVRTLGGGWQNNLVVRVELCREPSIKPHPVLPVESLGVVHRRDGVWIGFSMAGWYDSD